VKRKKAPPGSTKEETRSHVMRQVKGSNTSIELAFRKALWRNGVRYRKNLKGLPGKPDIVVAGHKIAIFCDGEFWHGKDWNLAKEKLKSRRDFWVKKIERTIERDTENERRLEAQGWTVMRFWGRDIEKNLDLCVADVLDAILQARVDSLGVACVCADEGFDGGPGEAAERPPDYGD